MRVWTGCAALLLLMLSGCGKDKGDGETIAAKPPTDQVYTCSSDSECRVSCESPGNCCGQGCECTNVYVEAEYQAFRAENTARCTADDGEKCDVYSCAKPTHKTIATCVDGACKGKRVPLTTMNDGYFGAVDSPDPLACTTADDCIGNTLPTENGCCNAPTSLGVYNQSYRAWLSSWRTKNCQAVTCPPPPNPSQPDECAFEMQCHEGRCANSCAP